MEGPPWNKWPWVVRPNPSQRVEAKRETKSVRTLAGQAVVKDNGSDDGSFSGSEAPYSGCDCSVPDL